MLTCGSSSSAAEPENPMARAVPSLICIKP
jgi:hypothetical protein